MSGRSPAEGLPGARSASRSQLPMARGADELVSVYGRFGLSSAAFTHGGPGGHGVTVVSPSSTETN